MSFKTLKEAWNRFWFEPTSPTPIALFRIIFGSVMLCHILMVGVDRHVWFHDSGILTRRIIQLYDRLPRIDLLSMFGNTKSDVDLIFLFFLIAAFCVIIGLFTRVSSVLLWMSLLSIHNRNALIINSGLIMAQSLAFYMIFSAAGTAMSVDRLIRIMRGKETDKVPLRSPWGQRLIQLQLTVVYIHATLSKLNGVEWVRGNAVHYVARTEHWLRFPWFKLFDYTWAARLMTWGTLVIEGLMGPLLWIKETRYFVMLLGLSLHLGLEVSMNIYLFQWVMFTPYITFIAPEHLTLVMDRIRAWIKRRAGDPAPVFYDGACEACCRGAMLIRAMDIFRRFQPVDFRSPSERAAYPELGAEQLARAEREMLIRHKDSSWVGGFEAFRTLAWGLPLLWPVAPLLHLPGMATLGNAAYSWISRNRFRFLGVRCGTACAS